MSGRLRDQIVSYNSSAGDGTSTHSPTEGEGGLTPIDPKEYASSGEPTRRGGGGAGAGPNTDEASEAGAKGDTVAVAVPPKLNPAAGAAAGAAPN
jgi:hypothetical protein